LWGEVTTSDKTRTKNGRGGERGKISQQHKNLLKERVFGKRGKTSAHRVPWLEKAFRRLGI